jgi:PleD family two-component response regulator
VGVRDNGREISREEARTTFAAVRARSQREGARARSVLQAFPGKLPVANMGLVGSMIRVLVVEDHLIVRDGLASLLGSTADIKVVAVASGIRDALPLLEQHDPQIVLADLSLEVAAGWSWYGRCAAADAPGASSY